MTQPAKRHHKQQIFATQRRQLWWVLIMTMIAAMFDWLLAYQGLIGKSVLAGALLHFIAQSVFTHTAYRTTGANASRQIMLNVYLGQMLKWLITLVGFALIFIGLKPIHALLVVLAYIVMQLCYMLSMLKMR